MHGHITAHGDSTDGITTTAGTTTAGTMEDSTIHGIMAAHGDSMTHGTMEDITEVGMDGTHITLITQDGTAASDGILTTIITITTQVTSQEAHRTRTVSEDRDIRPVQSALQQAAEAH